MVYSVRLNYAFRTGSLTGVAGQRSVNLAARPTPGHILAWEKQQELRPGAWTFSDHIFVPPGGPAATGRVLRLSKVIGRSGTLCDAPNLDYALLVDDGAGGCFIHGWPPCRCARCIVLPHGIDELVSAVDSAGTLTILFVTRPQRNHSGGLRPSDSPTRSLASRFAGSLRSRGSLRCARSRLPSRRLASP